MSKEAPKNPQMVIPTIIRTSMLSLIPTYSIEVPATPLRNAKMSDFFRPIMSVRKGVNTIPMADPIA